MKHIKGVIIKRILLTLITVIIIAGNVVGYFAYGKSENTTEDAFEEDSINKVYLTTKEQEYIQNHKEITIAMDTSWIPYAVYDSTSKNIVGIIPSILNTVSKKLGVKINYISKNSYIEAIETARSGETQLVSGIADDVNMIKKNNVSATVPYITINYSAITKDVLDDLYSKGAKYKVAVCIGSYSTMAMKEKMPTYEFIEYHSNEECMKAVNKGEADMALIATYAADFYKTKQEYSSLNEVMLNNFSWGLCFDFIGCVSSLTFKEEYADEISAET